MSNRSVETISRCELLASLALTSVAATLPAERAATAASAARGKRIVVRSPDGWAQLTLVEFPISRRAVAYTTDLANNRPDIPQVCEEKEAR